MKTYLYDKETIKITKNLMVKEGVALKDKFGSWIQIEFLTGERKGSRIPATMEELK